MMAIFFLATCYLKVESTSTILMMVSNIDFSWMDDDDIYKVTTCGRILNRIIYIEIYHHYHELSCCRNASCINGTPMGMGPLIYMQVMSMSNLIGFPVRQFLVFNWESRHNNRFVAAPYNLVQQAYL